MRKKWETELLLQQIRNGTTGNSRHRYRWHYKHMKSHSNKFLQTFPWFISFYDCKDKYTWSIVVSTCHTRALFPSLILSYYSFSRFLSSSLFSRCFRKTSSEHTWHLYQQVVWMITWSYRLNSLDNIYLADSIIRFISMLHRERALSSKRARNFINVFLYLLHEVIFVGKQTIVDTILLIYTRYMICPVILLSTEHFTAYIAEAYFAFHKWNYFRSILLWYFDRTLLMSVNHIKHCSVHRPALSIS